jgi:hypothetical protein
VDDHSAVFHGAVGNANCAAHGIQPKANHCSAIIAETLTFAIVQGYRAILMAISRAIIAKKLSYKI